MAALVRHASFQFDSSKCAEAIHKVRTKGALKFLCGVDGSEFSDLALQVTMSIMKKNDHLNLFHAFSSEDDMELPPHLRSSNLKDAYEMKLINVPKHKYTLCWEERFSDTSNSVIPVRTMLVKATDGRIPRCASDFLVVGFTGDRKHDDLHSGHHDGHGISYAASTKVGGTNADYTMRFIHIPTIVVKREVPTGGKTYVMAVDQSDVAKVGLEVIYTLLTPKDELTVLHVLNDEDDEVDCIKEYYQEDLDAYCPTVNNKYVVLVKSGHESVAHAIKTYVEEAGADFLCIAPKARTDGSFANLTQQVVSMVHTNIIMCKM